jgi:hypothetical protein
MDMGKVVLFGMCPETGVRRRAARTSGVVGLDHALVRESEEGHGGSRAEEHRNLV